MKTKKVITIGDLHGRSHWTKFADIDILLSVDDVASAGHGVFVPDYDYYVFIGDYTDSFTKQNTDIINNLATLIRFKWLYPNNVILLWGNHDVEYWKNLPWVNKNINITGFRPESHYQLFELFNNNRDMFQLAFQIDNYLWTHAGVHKGWYKYNFPNIYKNNGNIAKQLNEAFLCREKSIFFNDFRRGGSNQVGGPLWCSMELSSKKPLDGYHQIVGHTHTKEIKKYTINKNTSITFCDVMEDRRKFDKNKKLEEETHILNI
jgi:predicted phosphodiesterase